MPAKMKLANGYHSEERITVHLRYLVTSNCQ